MWQCLGTEGHGEGPGVHAPDSIYDVSMFKSVDIHLHPDQRSSPSTSPLTTTADPTRDLITVKASPTIAPTTTTTPLLNGMASSNITLTTTSTPSPPLTAAAAAYSLDAPAAAALDPPPAAASLGYSQQPPQIPVSTFLPISVAPPASATALPTAASTSLHHRSLQPSSAPFIPSYQKSGMRELRQIQNRPYNGQPSYSPNVMAAMGPPPGAEYGLTSGLGYGSASPIMMTHGPLGVAPRPASSPVMNRHRFQTPAGFMAPVPAGSCVDSTVGIPFRKFTLDDRQGDCRSQPVPLPAGVVLLEPNGLGMTTSSAAGIPGTDSLTQSRADLAGIGEGFSGLSLHDGFNGMMKAGMQFSDPNGNLAASASYASLIKSYATVGDENGAENVVRQLQDKNIKADVVMYNALISAYATNGNWQGAEDVLGRMVGDHTVQPNVVTFSSLINAYANKGNSDGAEGVLHRMQTHGVDPNVVTYNSVISAYAKEGNWQGAQDVLRRMMQNQNVEPNVKTYNAVINAYANKGHWQGAEDVLHRMANTNVQPNMTTYNSLIDAYANKGNWEGAEDVLRRMNKIKEMEPNVITFSSVINAYANKGNWQGAENVLRRMQYQGVQPNVITYNSLITAYAKEGNWQGAEEVLRRMHADPTVRPNVTTYNLIINAYANKGHWKGAEDVLHRLLASNTEPNVMTYNSLINAHAKDGNWEGAEDVMRRLLERGIEPNVTTFNSLIKAYTKEGNSDGAEDVLRRMIDFTLKPNVTTWSSVINAYATKGDWRGAEDVLRRMQEAGVEPNVTTYSSVINAYANKGHWMGAEDILRRMEMRGLEPDVITFNSLLKVYSNARDVDGCGRGLALVQAMVAKKLKPTHVTFKTLFGLLLKHPDRVKLNTALLLMHDHLPVRSRNSPIYAPLIELCGITGSIDAAMHYLDEARRGGHLDKYVIRAGRQAGLLAGHGGGMGAMENHPGRNAAMANLGRHAMK